MYIYKTTNLINNKIYIGQTKQDKQYYYGSGTLIKEAIKKYGKRNFKKEIIEYVENENDLDDKEKNWINYYKSNNLDIGYNLESGGRNYTNHHPLTIEKFKNRTPSFKDKKHTEETKTLLSDIKKELFENKEKHPMYCKKHTDESKKKMSGNRENISGKNNPMYNKSFYDIWVKKYGKIESDIKLKIWKNNQSKIHKNKKRPDLSVKFSGENNPFYNKNHTDESKKKMSESAKQRTKKKIYQYTLDHCFVYKWDSLNDIFITIGYKEQYVSRVCRGERKKYKNYIWSYKKL